MSETSDIKVLLLVGDWVEDYEAIVPLQCLQMLGISVDVVSPGKIKGQMVMSCIHDFSRGDIDGATDFVLPNVLGMSESGRYINYQAVCERPGHAVLINKSFDDVKINEYSGIFCPGGRSPETLQLDDKILGWIKQLADKNKPVASICHGIQIIATAGVIHGKKVTGHPCCKPQAVLAGALWEPTRHLESVQDGNVFTASEWTATPHLLRRFVNGLGVHWAASSGLSKD